MGNGQCKSLINCFALVWQIRILLAVVNQAIGDPVFYIADWNAEKLIFGHCLKNESFLVIYGLTVKGCQEECAKRKKCSSFNYIRHYPLCELNTVDQGNYNIQECQGYAYMNVSAQNSMRQGNCSKCQDSQVCENGNDCLFKECDEPQPSNNGKVLGNLHVIGSKRKHVCDSGNELPRHKTSEIIICSNETGRWEPDMNDCFPVVNTTDDGCGHWTDDKYCPTGSLAVGYKIQIESDFPKPVTSIQLTCGDQQGNVAGTIKSGHTSSANWTEPTFCDINGARLYITAIRLKLFQEATDCRGKNAVTYIKFQCHDLEQEENLEIMKNNADTFYYEQWGTWDSWSEGCRNMTAVCGLRTRKTKTEVNGTDRFGLTDIQLICCTNFNSETK